MTKPASAQHRAFRHSSFGFLSSFVIRHSSFNFLCAFLSVFGWPPPACGVGSVLGAWLNSQTQIQTWSAEVIQTRVLKSLAQPLTATGRVWFAAPNRFRWELGSPARTIALRQAQEMFVIYPKLNRAERYPLTGHESGQWRDMLSLLEAGFPHSRADLDSRFRIVSLTETNGAWQMALQPISTFARRLMKEMRVGLATNDFSLTSTELVFADGALMRNDFTNAVVNAPFDQAPFDWKPGPDFKVTQPLGR